MNILKKKKQLIIPNTKKNKCYYKKLVKLNNKLDKIIIFPSS